MRTRTERTILTRRECTRFLRDHWVHLLLAIPAAFACHIACEGFQQIVDLSQRVYLFGMEAAAARAFGRGDAPDTTGMRSEFAVSVAPYFLPVVLAATGVLVIARARSLVRWPVWVRQSVYVWLFCAPVLALAGGVFWYLIVPSGGDLRRAYGVPSRAGYSIALVLGIVFVAIGYLLHRKAYGSERLFVPGYGVLIVAVVVVLLAWCYVSSIGLPTAQSLVLFLRSALC